MRDTKTRNIQWFHCALLCLPLSLLMACGSSQGDSDGGPEIPCGETGEVLVFFEESCANPACHGPGGQTPLLTRAGVAKLAEIGFIEPGDSDGSFLVKKMSGDAPGALMPLGASTPSPRLALVKAWIDNGAKATCEELPPSRQPYDPNSLDQEELFACADPNLPRSSPARLRRVQRDEFTRTSIPRLTTGSRVSENPLEALQTSRYSTYTSDLSVDTSVLDLLTLILPEAAISWSQYDPHPSGRRLEGLYRTTEWRCLDEDTINESCRLLYIDSLLRRGALFRTPLPGETDRLRSFLDQKLAVSPGPTQRQEVLHTVAQAAFLMSGALFRSEVGDESGNLSNDELALSLGHVLSSHPVGIPFEHEVNLPGDPDNADRSLGRLTQVRAAANDGSIQEEQVRRDLLRLYAGGVSSGRPDLIGEVDERTHEFRGEYWLAPNIAAFFREWLEYEKIGFKDTPGSTGAWPDTATTSQRSYEGALSETIWDSGKQPMPQQQLDDTIARIVLESDTNGSDVFVDLMQSRHWALPSTTGIGGVGVQIDHYGALAEMYNIGTVANDPNARWQTLPASERMGLLTHPAWLAAHGDNFEDGPSLVHRGKWIRENLFSQTVPPLELVMVEAQLVPSHPDLSARDRVAQSTEMGPNSDTCWGCHRLMNPLGRAFEYYNHAGYLRITDHGGAPDGSTVITNLPDPSLNRSFVSPVELAEAIAQSRYARRGFIRQVFRYFMGRPEVLADGCTLMEMETALDSFGSFFAMLETLVSTETFTRRHKEGASP